METLYAILDYPVTKWVLLVFLFVMPLASLLTWAERRQSAMMQDRRGPNRANINVPILLLTFLVGGAIATYGLIIIVLYAATDWISHDHLWYGGAPSLGLGALMSGVSALFLMRFKVNIKLWGILHFIADAIKMIGKEDFVPAKAHKPLFSLAPILALAPVLIAVAIIPFGPTIYPDMLGQVMPTDPNRLLDLGLITPQQYSHDFAWAHHTITLQMFQVDFGLLFYFAILTVANYGATIAGWASYNKWALLGGLRSSSQMMSYEVSMGLSLMSVFLFMGTLEPGAMVAWQGPNPLHWGVLTPIPFAAFILFFTAAIAETKRAPFDVPEGEPEIIGYFVEYSGIRWGMFFLAEFIEIVFISMVLTTVFFGGYHFPFLYADGFHLGGAALFLDHWAVVLIQLATFGIKVVVFCWLQLAIRWTLPRFRADQIMALGWKMLLPLALANIMLAALISLWW